MRQTHKLPAGGIAALLHSKVITELIDDFDDVDIPLADLKEPDFLEGDELLDARREEQRAHARRHYQRYKDDPAFKAKVLADRQKRAARLKAEKDDPVVAAAAAARRASGRKAQEKWRAKQIAKGYS